jgi:RHS repeat-associated protein
MSSQTINYTYDPLYRLTTANYSSGTVFTYTFDAVGNRLSEGAPAGSKVYTYDDANRLATINGTTNYIWDNNGNLLDNGVGVTYTYDAANRLTAIDPTLTYGYDGLGNRVQQLAYGVPITYTLDQAAGLTQVLAETAGGTTTTYLYGQSRIDQQTTAGTDYFLGDALGSVRTLANASGDVTLQKSYDPYGQTLSSSGTGSSNYDFTGEYKDQTALFYLRARYYTSRRGRFIQKDSVIGDYGKPQSINQWVYAQDNPTGFTDPTGQRPCDPDCNEGHNEGTDQRVLPVSGPIWLRGYTENQINGYAQLQSPDNTACAPVAMAIALNLLYGVHIAGADMNLLLIAWLKKTPFFGTLPWSQVDALNAISEQLALVYSLPKPPFVAELKTDGAASDLIDNLSNGYPTIVNVSLGNGFLGSGIPEKIGHAEVVVGYVPPDFVFLDPGAQKPTDTYVRVADFLRDWLDHPNWFIGRGTMITLRRNR